MANQVTKYNITSTEWTLIGSGVYSLYVETTLPGPDYMVRILNYEDDAPTDAINHDTDIYLFQENIKKDVIKAPSVADIYCCVKEGTGIIKAI